VTLPTVGAVARDEVTRVWHVDLMRDGQRLRAIGQTRKLISQADSARFETTNQPAAREQRCAAHVAVRLLLQHTFSAAVAGLTLEPDAYGRPSLPQGIAGAFSLSHTQGHALIAVSRRPHVGVDLERSRVLQMSPPRRAIVEAAAENVANAPLPGTGDDRLLQAWVRLEALAKADGRGIGHLLTAAGAIGAKGPPSVGRPLAAVAMRDRLGVQVHDISMPDGLWAALACAKGGPTPALSRFELSAFEDQTLN
jgi:phosphopantetheinyl transferase